MISQLNESSHCKAFDDMLSLAAFSVGSERADLYAQVGAPPVSANPNVVIMGQDEFHDALESAAESASIASTSDRHYDSGQDKTYACICPLKQSLVGTASSTYWPVNSSELHQHGDKQ